MPRHSVHLPHSPESCIAVLETKRLVLRAPQLVDAKAVAALANDRRIAENTARIPHPYRLSDAESWIAGTKAEPGSETLSDHAGRRHGHRKLRLRHARRSRARDRLLARRPHWGKGYATEAVRALIDHAFTDLDHEALQSSVRVTNPDSRRVLEKCGFQWTGVGLCRIRALGSLGAGRPLPARTRHLDRAQELGPGEAGGVNCRSGDRSDRTTHAGARPSESIRAAGAAAVARRRCRARVRTVQQLGRGALPRARRRGPTRREDAAARSCSCAIPPEQTRQHHVRHHARTAR